MDTHNLIKRNDPNSEVHNSDSKIEALKDKPTSTNNISNQSNKKSKLKEILK